MKLIVTQENLSKALAVVGRVASNKTSLPILHNILLRTENNRLLLAATNLEIAITEYIGAKVVTDGSLTIPARLMTEFIAQLPKGNIELSVDGTKLHIQAGTYSSTIHGVSAEEFPELPVISDALSVVFEAPLLKRAIGQTILTASSDSTRPVLTGVYTHTFEGSLYFAATDGYRLSERRLISCKDEVHAIIPASTLADVVRVMPEDCKNIEMLVDDGQVRFRMNEIEITSRLIDGNFPDYRKLIPKTTEVNFNVDKDEFSRITKIASLFARESGGSVTIKTDALKSNISIHSVASQLGENTSEAEAKVTGDGSVTLNSRYLIEALGCVDASSISFGFSGKLAPCVVTADQKGTDYQHIIMPLKS